MSSTLASRGSEIHSDPVLRVGQPADCFERIRCPREAGTNATVKSRLTSLNSALTAGWALSVSHRLLIGFRGELDPTTACLDRFAKSRDISWSRTNQVRTVHHDLGATFVEGEQEARPRRTLIRNGLIVRADDPHDSGPAAGCQYLNLAQTVLGLHVFVCRVGHFALCVSSPTSEHSRRVSLTNEPPRLHHRGKTISSYRHTRDVGLAHVRRHNRIGSPRRGLPRVKVDPLARVMRRNPATILAGCAHH